MVSWLQGFCDKSKGQKDERDGLEILSDIMNSQIFNYLKAKRALIHLGTDSHNRNTDVLPPRIAVAVFFKIDNRGKTRNDVHSR